MMHASSASRKRAHPENNHKTSDAKRQATLRARVAVLYGHYTTLCNAPPNTTDAGAFQALLQAADGDLGAQRLAARLVPRFIDRFPDQVDAAAGLLRRLYEAHQDADGPEKPLAEHTRRDALHGLAAVLRAAPADGGSSSSSSSAAGVQAVKRVLDLLLKLLPLTVVADAEPDDEEEGEVTAADNPAVHGPWVRRTLRLALKQHPTTTLGHCFGCLSAAAASSSKGGGGSSADVGVTQGVRLWLKDYLLKEASPSREGTPLDGLTGTAAAAAAAAAAAPNGTAAGSAGGSAPPRRCILQGVLDASPELQQWIMQQARSRSSAPSEVRRVLETALQLLPAHQQLAAAKPPQLAAHNAAGGRQQPNGVSTPATRLANGTELSRSWSSPVAADRSSGGGRGPAAAAHGQHKAAHHQQQQPAAAAAADSGWGEFPRPGGPVCVVEPCLLVVGLPRGAARGEVQAALAAEEAWLVGEQRACCVYKSPLDAAKAYLRHNGQQRLPGQQQPLALFFTDRLPACSRAAATAPPSAFVWGVSSVVGKAEDMAQLTQQAGLNVGHVHRVNNAHEPGVLLQTTEAGSAQHVATFLLQKHAAAVAAYRRAVPSAADERALPPLPQEPPPPLGDWARGNNRPPAPPGAQQQQQQQQSSRTPGFRRVNSLPLGNAVPSGGGGWRDSPNTPTHHPLQQGGWQQQHGASPASQGGWQQQQQQPPSGGGSRWSGAGAGPSPPAANGPARGSPAAAGPPPLPLPPPGMQHAAGRVLWAGSLFKQAVRQCGVLCLEVGGPARATGLAPEPHAWPEQLHVNYRITVPEALSQYQAAAPGARAIRVLVPADPGSGDEAALRHFADYLAGKERAGMVKLPAQPGGGPPGPRSVFLLVPRPPVCEALQVAWDGQCAMLIAVVVPQAGGPLGAAPASAVAHVSGSGALGGSSGGGAGPPLPPHHPPHHQAPHPRGGLR